MVFNVLGVPINLLAVVVATIFATVIGFGWYSEALFGKQWMKLIGMTKESLEKAKKEMGPKYGLMVLSSLVLACVLAGLVRLAGSMTVVGGAKVGFFAWIGFVATIGLNGFIFENKPINLYFINVGYHLVSFIVMGAILAMMG